MTHLDLPALRLRAQKLIGSELRTPSEVVAWLGAVQAQDHAGAKWALGQRLGALDEAAVEGAFARGELLRTHVLRPTWHLVTPADLRWMLTLTAPRIHAASAIYWRKLGLDDATFEKSEAVMRKALRGGKQLTRTELAQLLGEAGVDVGELQRVGLLMMHAELEGVLCSGAMRGKQHTYALLEERAPGVPALTREASLTELARRYFRSHGPATLKDYAWWSGLSTADARSGLERVEGELEALELDGRRYWMAPDLAPIRTASAFLLPNYDEYIVAYADRSAVLGEIPAEKLDARGNVLFHNTLVIDGRVAGTWRRTLQKREVVVETVLFEPLSRGAARGLDLAIERYGVFLGLAARRAGS